ncbi:MAG: hypothetical protein KDE11_15560 [Rhodobacteraceae bacterium]|nr:hypothetical protein [Paracoccaceae bacterium]
MKVLFVCTANKLRSPTAEDLFKGRPGFDVLSAGTSTEAPRPLTRELVASADLIFVMESHHRERIRKKFRQRPRDEAIITLHIPDEYERNDPVLIKLLEEKAGPYLLRPKSQIPGLGTIWGHSRADSGDLQRQGATIKLLKTNNNVIQSGA